MPDDDRYESLRWKISVDPDDLFPLSFDFCTDEENATPRFSGEDAGEFVSFCIDKALKLRSHFKED